MIRLACLILLGALLPAFADSLVATRTMRANTALTAGDIARSDRDFVGGLTDLSAVLGMETRVVIYAGRPILGSDIGPPAIVERNQIVPLIYRTGTLHIATEGRSLARGAAGDRVRVMNLASRSTVSGTVSPDGSIIVSE